MKQILDRLAAYLQADLIIGFIILLIVAVSYQTYAYEQVRIQYQLCEADKRSFIENELKSLKIKYDRLDSLSRVQELPEPVQTVKTRRK